MDCIFFDFDGTLIRGDSFYHMVCRGFKAQPWRLLPLPFTAFVLCLPWYWSKGALKSFLLWHITVGNHKRTTVRNFQKWGQDLVPRFYKPVGALIAGHRIQGIQPFYISGASPIWLRPALNSIDPGPKHILGTPLRFGLWNGVVLKSKNCVGKNKLFFLNHYTKRWLGSEKINWVEGYSDHVSDGPMLKKCGHCFMINPSIIQLMRFKNLPFKPYIYLWS